MFFESAQLQYLKCGLMLSKSRDVLIVNRRFLVKVYRIITVKLLVGSEMFKEIFEISLEACLFNNLQFKCLNQSKVVYTIQKTVHVYELVFPRKNSVKKSMMLESEMLC